MKKKIFIVLMGLVLMASMINGFGLEASAHHGGPFDVEIGRDCELWNVPGVGSYLLCTVYWLSSLGFHTSWEVIPL